MANMLGSAIVAEIQKNITNRTDVDATRILLLLNLMQLRLCKSFDFHELQTVDVGTDSTDPYLQSGTSVYSLATILSASAGTMRTIHEIRRISNDYKLIKELLVRRQDDSIPQADFFAVEVSSHYIRTGDNILVLQAPDANEGLLVRWSVYPTDILVGTSSQLENKDDLLIAMTTSWIFMSLRMTEEGERWLSIAINIANNSLEMQEIGARTITRTIGNMVQEAPSGAGAG